MTPEKAAECGRLLDGGATMAAAARVAGVNDSTLRKAVAAGRVHRYLALPDGGYYNVLHILERLGFMALARIRRPEGLRHIPP